MDISMEKESLDDSFLQVMKFRKQFSLVDIAALMLDINPKVHLVQHKHTKGDLKGLKSFLIVENKEDYRTAIENNSKTTKLHPKHRIFIQLLNAMKDAIQCGDLYIYEGPMEVSHREQLNLERQTSSDLAQVQKHDVAKWAVNCGFQCDFFGTKMPQDYRVSDYFDKNNPEHSIELGIAIEAWQRFSGLNISHPKAYVKKWLVAHYTEQKGNDKAQIKISNKAIERITMLINWNPSGGTTKEGVKNSIYEQAIAKDLPQKL
jgi:hypothetical protein